MCAYTYRHNNDDGLMRKRLWWSETSLRLYLTLPDPHQAFIQTQFMYHRSHSGTAAQHGAVLPPVPALRWTGFSAKVSYCPAVQSLETSSAHAGNQTVSKRPEAAGVSRPCLSLMRVQVVNQRQWDLCRKTSVCRASPDSREMLVAFILK